MRKTPALSNAKGRIWIFWISPLLLFVIILLNLRGR